MLKFIIPVLLLAYGANSAFSPDLKPIIANQHFPLHALLSTFTEKNINGLISVEEINACFSSYTSKQEQILDTYNTAYSGCVRTAEDARDALTQQNAEEREDILSRGNSICSQLSSCEQYTDGYDFFKCYSQAAETNYPNLYGISVDSSSTLNNIEIKTQQIENEEKSCTTTALNTYVSDLATANEELTDCLNGNSEPGTTAEPPVTEPDTTTEPPVTEPDTTTEPPVTEPDTTTEPPETEPPVTEPPVTEPPVTEPPVTEPPTTTVEVDTTTEPSPEEDSLAYKPMSRMNMWNVLRRL